MITVKFDIFPDKEVQLFIRNKQLNYSHAFRKLYVNFNRIKDKEFTDWLSNRYNLSCYEFNCLIIDVKTKVNQTLTNKTNLEYEILSLTSDINKLTDKPKLTKKENIKLTFLKQKLKRKEDSLSKDITFGTRELLKRISFLNNDKLINYSLIFKLKQEYTDNRILPFNYVGSSNDPNSNRYFIFDFNNNLITYKPSKGVKINIPYKVKKKYRQKLLQIQKIKELNIIPVSIKLTSKLICVSYDEETLNGYGFNKKEYFKEVKEIPKENTTERKELYKKYIKEQESRKLRGKLNYRYCGLDLNPEYIGISIIDKLGLNKHKVVKLMCCDLRELTRKPVKGKDETDEEFISRKKTITNKLKYEIGCIYVELFKILKQYKVGSICIEDFNFKDGNINEFSREFNRKVKGIWNLNLQLNLISKHCNEQGYILIPVNPVYSSLIGNIMNKFFDPVSASIEIGRRGSVKYDKGGLLLPELTEKVLDTALERLNAFTDVLYTKNDLSTWNKMYKLFNNTGFRYRNELTNVKSSSRKHIKCNWNLYQFS